MDGFTRLTNLEVTGVLKVNAMDIDADDYKVTSDNAPDAGDSYTKADIQKLVTLANEIKADLNALVAALAGE